MTNTTPKDIQECDLNVYQNILDEEFNHISVLGECASEYTAKITNKNFSADSLRILDHLSQIIKEKIIKIEKDITTIYETI